MMALDCWLGLAVQIGLAIRYIRPTWRRPFERTATDPVVQRVYTSSAMSPVASPSERRLEPDAYDELIED